MCRRRAFREGMLALPYQLRDFFNSPTSLFLNSSLFILLVFLLCVMPWQFATAQTSPLSPCSLTNIDEDNDGLIDICDLEGLDAIRYQLDGTGYRESRETSKTTAGCPSRGCNGYELMRDLDFLDASSYRAGRVQLDWVLDSGWLPIKNIVTSIVSTPTSMVSTPTSMVSTPTSMVSTPTSMVSTLTSITTTVTFEGMFQGNGHAIRNLMINRPSIKNIGLFAVNTGEIRDIRLLDVNIEGASAVGALVAINDGGTIKNSHVSGSIRGVSRIGALVGVHGVSNNPSFFLENSSATGIVIGTGNQVGGLVGINFSTIRNSQAFNTVSGANDVGGLVGAIAETNTMSGQIINSYATGNVTGNRTVGGLIGNAGTIHVENSSAHGEVIGTRWIGGLVGFINFRGGIIEKSHATGNVTGDNTVGGLLGAANARTNINNSYATGNVQGGQGSFDMGGFAGAHFRANITNSYATGNVQGGDESVSLGGFIGQNLSDITNSHATGNVRVGQRSRQVGGFIGIVFQGSITNSYATGNVQGDEESHRVGGFIGYNRADIGDVITNSYATGDVQGQLTVGGFIGENEEGRVTDSYATGDVTGAVRVGGFIGGNGVSDFFGFVSPVNRNITNSYAIGNVSGFQFVGGFIGQSAVTDITNSYATGDVRGGLSGLGIGGFIGAHFIRGSITNSYAIGKVEGGQQSPQVGGFIGANDATITNSYWDESTSGRTESAGGEGKTTLELQAPIEAGSAQTDIYYDWDEQVWDFGTSEQYPALKYSDGTLRPNQRLGLLRLGLPSGLIVSPSFKSEVLSYRIIDETQIRRLRLTPVAANPDANIIIESGGGFREQVSSGTTSSEISLNTAGVSTATVEVLTSYDAPIEYTLAFNDRTFNEGEHIILQRATSQGVDQSTLRYKWTQISGMPRVLPIGGISEAVLDVAILEASLGKTEADSEITIRLETSDGTTTETKDLRLTIAKADNGTVVRSDSIITRSDRTLTAPEINLSTDPDGVGTINSYLWQRREDRGADWIDIESATANTYRIPENTALYTEYRVQYGYTDGQGYTQTFISEVLIFITDVDTNDNGLIEINDLEGLDAIRYQLDGSGYRQNETANKITAGCPNEVCKGYELTRSLDFKQGASYRSGVIRAAWTSGSGWQPIGTPGIPFITPEAPFTIPEAPFDAIFNANGHTIANLRIDRGDAERGVGLFGVTASNAKIENVGLLSVDILGNQGVGGLVGYKRGGSIVNSYVTGQVRGVGAYDVGGLVGWHRGGTISNSHSSSTVVGLHRNTGGLVGDNDGGTITNSYARGSVSGSEKVGGLVGKNSNTSNTGVIMRSWAEVKVTGGAVVGGLVGENNGIITNSYTKEHIIGTADVGGFVGWNLGDVTNSYALGFVRGNNGVGGFIGNNLGGTITNSYAGGNVDGVGRYIGGLVGWNARGAIINSYAQGNVSGNDGVGGLVGVNRGLVHNPSISRVSKSYATGRVRGDRNSGGLVGENRDGRIEKSYWNRTNNPTVVSAGGTSKTRVEMLTSTQPGNNATEIYYDWNTADWDFGGTDQYPTLKYAVGPNQGQPACGTAGDPVCGEPLTGQLEIVRTASIEPISDISLLTRVAKELSVVLSVGIGDDPTKLETSVRSSNHNVATASIPEGGDLIRTLRIETGSDIGSSEITVLVDNGEGLADSVSSTTFVVTTRANNGPRITITPLPESIPVGERVVILVEVTDDDFDAGDRVFLTSSVVPGVLVEPRQIVRIRSNTMERITLEGVRGGNAMIEFTVLDSKGATDSETVSVRVGAEPAGSVRIEPDSSDKWLLRATSMIEDADDIVEVAYQWYRESVAIAGATSRTYVIPDNREGRATGTAYRLELTIVDNLRRSVVIRSDSYRVVNEPPVVIVPGTEMINEGDTRNIGVSASDPNYDDLMYRWKGDDSDVLSNETSKSAVLSIPPYYIKDAPSTQTTLNLEVEVSDGDISTSETLSVVVNKQNNGFATLETSIEIAIRGTTLTATILSEDPDGGTSGTVVYQWQVCARAEGRCPSANDWMNIDEATMAQYIVSGADILLEGGSTFSLVEGGSLFRVEGTYIDSQGYSEKVYSPEYSYARLNASPTISGIPLQRIRLLEGTETKFELVLNDANPDDIPSDLMFSIKSDRLEVARLSVEGENTTRTIRITGVGVGITTITATVNDGRSVPNSEVLEQFEVEIEGNEAPMLEVTTAQQIIEPGNTTQVMVLVSDNNFDVGDSVVVGAMSSSRSIVSVIPTRTDAATTNSSVTFTLTSVEAGTATVIFTATDSRGSTTNISLLVLVDAIPTGSVRIEPDSSDKWLLRATSMIEDADDIVEINYQWYREGVAIAGATSQTHMIPDNKEGRAIGTAYRLELIIVDDLRRMVAIQSNPYMIVNEQPIIIVSAVQMIGEGDTRDISVQASDPNYDDLMYSWKGDDSDVLSNETSKSAVLSIPADYIKDAVSTRTTLDLEVKVDDGDLSTTGTVSVVVEKQNNGSARLGITFMGITNRGTTLTVMMLSDDPDGGTSGTVVYQWQVCAGVEGRCPSANDWMDIDGATEERYMISGSDILVEGGSTFSLVEGGSIFRVEGTYTDVQGYKEEVDSPVHVYTTRPVIRIRIKVFLEGPLQ